MALTAAERQKRRSDKLKQEGKYDAYKQKHSLQMKKYRKRKAEKVKKLPLAIQNELKNEERKRSRKRVAKFRHLKKERLSSEKIIESPQRMYKSASALGKALAKAKRGLPSSPRRKEVVVRKLFSSECNIDLDKSFHCQANSSQGNPLSQDTLNKIQEFYERDDISRLAPGRKDVVTIWENGKKLKKQARHLVYSIREVFELFKIDNPYEVVGKSKFSSMRPKHVLLSNKLPHNVCLCLYHENFINAVNALHQYNEEVPAYSYSFPEEIICKSPSRNCWLNECQTCNNSQGFQKVFPLPDIDEANVKWKYWKKDQSHQLLKVESIGSYSDLHSYVANLVPQFLEHCYIKRQQANFYKNIHQLVLSDQYPRELCVIQVDFSENYTCVFQDEIQSAHWQQHQVSIFTAALYYSGFIHPVALVSDFLNHSKEAVICYISYLLDNIPSNIQQVEIWSDGPSSQFKNRFVAASLNVLEDKYSINVTWNYFATSHGKGPVDGIGGSLKRQVFDQVKKRKCLVVNAAGFVQAAKMAGGNIHIQEITEANINDRNSALNMQEVWDNSPLIQGIKKYHCIKVENKKAEGFLISSDNKISFQPLSDNKCDDWYEIEYDGVLYPGKITNCINGEFEITTMEPKGKQWKWPEQEDKIFYPRLKLIQKLKPPTPVNSREFFTFVS